MKMLIIMSHMILNEQIEEARKRLNVDSIVILPEDIKKIWSNITPLGPLPIATIDRVVEWIKDESVEGDYVLVQGDFGSTFYVVDYCFKSGRVPIYATTNREVEEKVEDGVTKTSRIFKHVNFRKYVSYDRKR